MRHLDFEDIVPELGWCLIRLIESINIGYYIEKESIERYNSDLQKRKDKPISFTDIVNKQINFNNIFEDVSSFALKDDRITTSLIREMILCNCHGAFDYYSMRTYRVAISMVGENSDNYDKFVDIKKRLIESDIQIDLENIPLYEETQMIRRLRNRIIHNNSVIPRSHIQAQMKPDEYNKFIKYLKDRSNVIEIIPDRRIVISRDYFRHALEVMYNHYREVSNCVYDFAMS